MQTNSLWLYAIMPHGLDSKVRQITPDVQAAGGQGTADGVARIISLDLPTYASLFTVTAILAPILEETVFRGFLLTSLTKWMPTPAAVLVRTSNTGMIEMCMQGMQAIRLAVWSSCAVCSKNMRR